MTSTEATVYRDSPARKPSRSVRDRLLEPNRKFSNSEMKAVRVLLANYPAAGLTTVSKLAKQAGVSDPTVLRLAQRLGYDGFAGMQEALLAEVEAHMRSPLTLPAAAPSRKKPNAYQAFFAETLSQCEAVVRETATADYERAVALLTDARMEVLCLGGRFSRFLAGILQRCLHHLREGTRLLDGTAADLVDEIASLGKRHVLVVFDYRRYQTDVVRFASEASARGAHIILFTDQWSSPIAEFAEVVIIAPTATSSPFDTLVTPLLQVEAVAVGVAGRLGADWRSRAALLEEVRNDHSVTLDSPSGLSGRKRQRKG
ncbi:MAG: MurR/RpiR family transcriptional regulator [Aestuariivirga sp.]|uniref:MurR/RpiR family transcriptional regulator n=1 Tax=Aestuariivirga sp. TaxID=2650926 RepID=UPI0025B7B448|nr:MurR/RpiR family transcriptional regulator [Aestuariivirga sp.]MCA3561913.1 MurR/RpiR family transcriptional regulator [Aestuariivirga sp.]